MGDESGDDRPGDSEAESPTDEPTLSEPSEADDVSDTDTPDDEDAPDTEDAPDAEDSADADTAPDGAEDSADAEGADPEEASAAEGSADADDADAADAEDAADVPDDAPESEPAHASEVDDASGADDAPADDGEEELDIAVDPADDEESGPDEDLFLDEDDPNAEEGPVLSPPDEAEADAATPGHESDGGHVDEDPFAEYDEYEIEEPTVVEGAPEDEEMPLADHIEEMVKRLGVVVVVMAVISGIIFPFGEDLINFLWYSYLPGTVSQCPPAPGVPPDQQQAACPRVYHPLALILARLKVATLGGFIAALPVFVYETYLFMRPGLYPHERRYYLASVPTSIVLAAIGVGFAHLLVLPAIFTYFVYYSENATIIAFGLSETFDLMVLLMGGFAFIFQIPLFVMLALMMGLVTREWMVDRRLLFWGAFGGLAFLFSPDPTGMAPFIVAATMIVLFEGTLLLAKWTGR